MTWREAIGHLIFSAFVLALAGAMAILAWSLLPVYPWH